MTQDLPFDLEDLLRSGVKKTLRDLAPELKEKDIEVQEIHYQHHSIVGVISLPLKSGERKSIFFKKHTLPFPHSSSTDPSDLLHRREGELLNRLYHNINRTLAPRLLGRITNPEKKEFLLFTEYLGKESAKTKFLNLEKDNLTARLALLREGFKQIAKFNGLCRAYKNHLPPFFHTFTGTAQQAHQQKQELRKKRLLNYLLRIIHFWEMGGKEFQETEGKKGNSFEAEKVIQYLQQKKALNLPERLQQIYSLEEAIKVEIRLQHGDCRLQHNFNGKFCDLEDFGYYPWYRDIVTYTSEEIATPPPDEIPGLLAYYLLYERAFGSKSKDFRIKEIEEVEEEDPSNIFNLLSKKVSLVDFANFVVGYLSEVLIENDIIQDGINKKYSQTYLQSLYPDQTLEDIHQSKLNHFKEIYHYLTFREEPKILAYCSNGKEVRSYFFQLGKLLQDLNLVEIENLGVLSNGSQWDLIERIFIKK